MDKDEIKRRLRAKADTDPKLQKAIAHSGHVKVDVPVRHIEPVKDITPLPADFNFNQARADYLLQKYG